ncbi:MAG: hypothetical protein BroJett029_34980 [Alphaproteobacteria bacterium]|nr:MAG: hypothetical protein BroJett029_34980 [Alphaproteobacteria bacterium]
MSVENIIALRKRHPIASAVALLLSLGLSTQALAIPDQVKETKITGEYVTLATGATVWRETITYENISGMKLENYIATSQPFSGFKWKEDENEQRVKGDKTADKLQQLITLEIGESKTISFDHPPLPKKEKYKSKYTDVYKASPLNDANKVFGQISNYVLSFVPEGSGGTFASEFAFPYPDSVFALDVGPQTFFIDITDTLLPDGWSLVDFSPLEFTIDVADSQIIRAIFSTVSSIFLGDLAFVNFDIFRQGVLDRPIHSHLGVEVVPEPTTLSLFIAGLMVLLSRVKLFLRSSWTETMTSARAGATG